MAARIFSRLMAPAMLALACAGAPGLALAQDGPWDRRGPPAYGPDARRDDYRDWREQQRRADDARYYRDGYRRGYADGGFRAPPPPPMWRPLPPPPPRPAWGYGYVRGARYYDAYRGPIYVVDRYPDYRLPPPRRGYHWVRDDRGNFLMVAIASGIIADILLNR